MKRLDKEVTEAEIEVGLSKLRYDIRQIDEQRRKEEIEYENSEGKRQRIERLSYEEHIIEDAKERQVFDHVLKNLDLAKKRVTDLDENSRVVLPKPASDALESEMEVIRETIMREFKKYKRKVEEKLIKVARNKEKKKKEKIIEKENKVATKRKRDNGSKETDSEKKEKERVDVRRNQEWCNLTGQEKRGLKKLRNR